MEAFHGTINRTIRESEPWWPDPVLPTAEAPNVLVVLFDDTGFGHFGCYGGPIDTPNIDRLASQGLRYNAFHTTALCSPTRASLLTGRNHHSVGMQSLSNFDSGFPNMRGEIPPSAATVAQLLQQEGYATFCVGKWHLAPTRESSAAGPFHNWPLAKGFNRFYGFMQGETDQFHPELVQDNHPIDPPATPEEGYHLTEDLIDQSIAMLSDQHSLVPERPWFLYLPLGATHAPHQAPAAYLDKYRGRFDEGWDVWRERVFARQLELGIVPEGTTLPPRNPGVEAWDDLSFTEQAFACRLQEAFAAFLDHTDAQLGRLFDWLDSRGLTENTLIIVASDNGASQEGLNTGVMDEFRYFNGLTEDVDAAAERLDDIGTRRSHSNYPWGWSMVGNCPGRWYKQTTHAGGVRDPLIVSWPSGIDAAVAGQIRPQFHHVCDIAPTILDVAGVTAPESVAGVAQQPIEGVSMRYTFEPRAQDGQAVPSTKQSQHFEMWGHRAIWSNGWKAVILHQPNTTLDEGQWELYHLDTDFSESRNLAADYPEKVAELDALFWAEAERYNVFPIEDRGRYVGGFAGRPVPGTPRARDTFVYYPPVSRVPSDAMPGFGARSWTIDAELSRQADTASGVLLSAGSVNNGLAFFIDDGYLSYEHNYFNERTVIRAPQRIPAGTHTVSVNFDRVRQGAAAVVLSLDGTEIARGYVPRVSIMISSIGMDIGRGLNGVTDRLARPGRFEGELHSVVVTTRPWLDPQAELAAEIAAALATQ